MTHPVTVQYFKYPETPHWRHQMLHLGEDAHGVWLGAPIGAVVQRASEPPKDLKRYFVQLIPPNKWWTAIFNGPGDHDMSVYVDVTTVARWIGDGEVHLIDLDLDVIRRTDGSIHLDDEDEFSEHAVSLHYPARLVDGARNAAARLMVDIERSAPPFDGTAQPWLNMVSVLGGVEHPM